MRAHALSASSPSAGNFTRTRPMLSGSLLFVTCPSTIPPAHVRLLFGVIMSTRLRDERPAVEKIVRYPCVPWNRWVHDETTYVPPKLVPIPSIFTFEPALIAGFPLATPSASR